MPEIIIGLIDLSSVHSERRSYEEHLRKYKQTPGQTTGETNRMERELEEMRRMLRERGVDV